VPLIETTLVAESRASYGEESGGKKKKKLTKKQKESLIRTLLAQMQTASRALEFERAAELRDMIIELEGSLPGKKKKGA